MPKESPIPGVPLINPNTLQPEFRQFRNDALCFINNVMFHPEDAPGGDSATAEKAKKGNAAKARILAVTPQAVFVCDSTGQMDRAVRLEQLDGLVFEKRQVKRLFSKEVQVHAVLKCPAEFDIYVVLEGNKEPSNEAVCRNLAKCLEAAVTYRKGAGTTFTVREVEGNIEEQAKKDKPTDYLSPKDIIAQNQARQRAVELVDSINREILELQERITIKQRSRDDKDAELRSLEGAMGGNVQEHRKRKESLTAEHQRLHREHVAAEVELMRLTAEINTETARLQTEREDADQMIQQSLSAASGAKDKEVEEADALRARARKKEIEKATKHLEALKAKVKNPPTYAGPEHIASRARTLEQKVQAAVEAWEKEVDRATKLDGYFDTAVSDLNVLNEQIAILLERKMQALKDRDDRQRAARPQAAPSPPKAKVPAAPAFDDDDLLGGGGGAPAPAAGGIDDDDLLGGGGAPSPPRAAAPVADDDDLLGGGASAPVNAAPAAAGADDDGLL